MFTFVLKENKTDIEIIITRILLALAAIGTLLYANQTHYLIAVVAALFLLLASYFVKTISARLQINRITVLIIAAVVLFVVTRSFIFAAILLCYAALLKFLQKIPEVIITADHVLIKKIFTNDIFLWTEFNNIILKDGILTIDFIGDKLLQVSVDENKTAVDEQSFNLFCKEQLKAV